MFDVASANRISAAGMLATVAALLLATPAGIVTLIGAGHRILHP